jgi:hypothetical protein
MTIARGNKHWFDLSHGKGAFQRLRSMLDDPSLAYQHIGSKFGLTRQRIAQLAKELGVNARQRQCERASCREPSVIYLPVNGKDASDSSKKPQKDWNCYEGAWHLLGYAEKSSLQ